MSELRSDELPAEPEIGHMPWRGPEWEERAGAAVLLIVVCALIVGVFWRYVLGHPLIWTGPIAQFSLIWISFIGATVGFKREIHLTADVFGPLFGKKSLRRYWDAFVKLITIVAMVLFTWYSAIFAWGATSVTAIPGLLWREIHLIAPVTCALAVGYLTQQLVRGFRS